MAAQDNKVTPLRPVEADYQGRLGEFVIEVRGDAEGGSLVLTPPVGAPLVLRVKGDALELAYDGPQVRLVAPGAEMELAAKNVSIRAEDTVAIHGAKEVDLHSGEDVEIRADHQVNLWAHGVVVGD
ncbi:MAG: hypothetical protein KDA24_22845 [Deltaproteobacteria bacterium]|nr:hypothetical protein [Deltaproteobacteria bacterium]